MSATTPIERYAYKFDEINKLVPSFDTDPKKARDDFFDMLIDAYVEGFAGAEYMLGVEDEIDGEEIAATVTKEYDGEPIGDKFDKYFADKDKSSLTDLWDSEFHRSYNQGASDLANRYNAMKKWRTMRDPKVRDTHRYIEGIIVPVDYKFVTFDGDEALFPGGFNNPANNANCRCVLEYLPIEG